MPWLTACEKVGASFNRKEKQKGSLRLSNLELMEQGFGGGVFYSFCASY